MLLITSKVDVSIQEGATDVDVHTTDTDTSLVTPPAPTTTDTSLDEPSLTRAEIEAKHQQILHTSHTNKPAYMRFCRQANSSKRPIPASLAQRFVKDKQSLFLDYIESGEDWMVCTAIESRRQIQKKEGKKKFVLKSKRDLLRQYGDGERGVALVNQIIETKRKQGLASPNPDLPTVREEDLFYCLGEISLSEKHISEHCQELRGESEVDKELATDLFKGSSFGDSSVPLRSGHPTAVWDIVSSSQQSGNRHVSDAEFVPSLEADNAANALAAILGKIGVGKTQQNSVMLAITGADSTSRKRTALEDGLTTPKPKKTPKAKVKKPETPLTVGKELEKELVKEKQDLVCKKNQLKEIAASDSIQRTLAGHEQEFLSILEVATKLLSGGCDDEEGWAETKEKAAALRVSAKATMSIADDVLRGHLRRSANKGKPVKARKSKTADAASTVGSASVAS